METIQTHTFVQIAFFPRFLQTAGESTSTASGGVVPTKNDLAACQVTPGSEWILAKVLHHDPNTGVYKLADEDVESNKSAFRPCWLALPMPAL